MIFFILKMIVSDLHGNICDLGRYIDSPSHAARFVSLIGVDKSQDQGISKYV
jgi:hypothetical protein